MSLSGTGARHVMFRDKGPSRHVHDPSCHIQGQGPSCHDQGQGPVTSCSWPVMSCSWPVMSCLGTRARHVMFRDRGRHVMVRDRAVMCSGTGAVMSRSGTQARHVMFRDTGPSCRRRVIHHVMKENDQDSRHRKTVKLVHCTAQRFLPPPPPHTHTPLHPLL